jgi:diaminopimelate epimerase
MIEQAFWKYEGTANDFIVVEGDDASLDLDPAVVAHLCDRHRGVGADGVLLVTPPSVPREAGGAAARMVVRNADGSRPEMCGNGLRCVALHVAARGTAVDARGLLPIETDAGLKECLVERTQAGSDALAAHVTVDMGVIRVGDTLTLAEVTGLGRPLTVTRADAGNPHAITFDPLAGDELAHVGARLQNSREFPHGVNLEHVVVESRTSDGTLPVRVRVFERGVGYTMACGTGACAVAAVLVARKAAAVGSRIAVALPGGVLTITIDEQGRASMKGPARRAFEGIVRLRVRPFSTTPSGGAR